MQCTRPAGENAVTRIPRGPSSLASVLVRPMTPSRMLFESTRFSMGCLTDNEVMVTMLPPPCLIMCGTAA